MEYDFRRPMTLARDHARLLEVAFGTFSRQWANQLLAQVRVGSQVRLEQVGMRSYEEYITALPARTTMVLFAAGHARRPALLQFPLEAALTWVDHLLGGSGSLTDAPERDLTEIEQQLVGQLMTRVLADLDYAFSGVTRIDPDFRRIQHSPQLLQATAASTAVVIASFTLTVDEEEVEASLMIPAEVVIDEMRDREVVETRSEDEVAAEEASRSQLDLAVQRAPVEVAVRLGPVPVHPREVGDLSVGTLIPLRHSSSQPMDVVVSGRVLAQAVAGTRGSRLAGLVVNVKENS